MEKAAKGKISSDLSSAEDSTLNSMALRKKKKIHNITVESKNQPQSAKKKCLSPPPIFEESSG